MANEIKVGDAVNSLKPNGKYVCRGVVGDYIIEWESGQSDTEPTKSEIDAEVTRLQAEYDNKKYQRDRAQEYPRIAEQLDKIYHSGIDAWKVDIKAVKDKYPKP